MMSVYEFGERLIETRDLDPVYVGLHGADLPRDQLRRWLTAYWMFYHVGAASWLSEKEGDGYWLWMANAAANVVSAPVGGRWPRAAERRHFRGPKCVAAVVWFSQAEPGYHVERLEKHTTMNGVMAEVESWPMHGSWVSFKAADMMERVIGVPLKMNEDLGLVYKEPRAALNILAEERETTPSFEWSKMIDWVWQWQAPPRDDRPCYVTEAETCLCKWKSHRNGHYEVGKDIREVRHALAGWGETADRLLRHMPEEVG